MRVGFDAAANGLPQLAQKRSSGSAGVPQEAQDRLSLAPHSVQNLASARFSRPQLEQSIVTSLCICG